MYILNLLPLFIGKQKSFRISTIFFQYASCSETTKGKTSYRNEIQNKSTVSTIKPCYFIVDSSPYHLCKLIFLLENQDIFSMHNL